MSYRTTRSPGDHPARGRASVPAPRQPWGRRWGKRLYQGVIGVGALAAAVAAVLALRPPHDAEDAAEFKRVAVTVGVPFNDYKQHLVAPHRQAVSMGRLTVALVEPSSGSTDVPGPEDTNTADTGPSPAVGPPADDGGQDESGSKVDAPLFDQARTTSPAVTAEPTIEVYTPPPAVSAAESGRVQNKVQKDCERQLDEQFCRSTLLEVTNVAGEDGDQMTSKEVIARQAAMVGSLRTVKPRGSTKPEPVGVVVVVNVDLSGLRGKPVLLSWSMWQKNGVTRLYREWLNERLAYRMTASSDHDTASVDFWIPLPKATGPYFIRSRMAVGNATLTTADSEPFS